MENSNLDINSIENLNPDEIEVLDDLEETIPDEKESALDNDYLENGETYLTFVLKKERFAVKVELVKEVFTKTQIYPIPLVSDYVKGVINLRGNIIPVIDLSMLFYNHPIIESKLTSIVVVEIPDENEIIFIGIMVDDIHEVLKMNENEISLPPDFGANIKPEYLQGIVNRDKEYIVVLNPNQIFDIDFLSTH